MDTDTLTTPVLDRPEAATEPERARLSNGRWLRGRVPAAWSRGVVVAWFVAFVLLDALEGTPPPDLAPPLVVDVVAGGAAYVLMAGLVGLAFRRRWGLVASAAGGFASMGTVTWCATHLGFSAPLFGQLVVVAAMVGLSGAGLIRTSRV